jgi:nucleoside-diphosphate-sugar epimerase
MIIEKAGSGRYTIQQFPKDNKNIEIGDYIADIRKIKKLGWTPKVSLENGLKMTFNYYKKYRSKYW